MSDHIPNDDVVVKNARLAVKQELEKKRARQQPIARFDPKTKEIYMESSDGSRQHVGKAAERRYSERKG